MGENVKYSLLSTASRGWGLTSGRRGVLIQGWRRLSRSLVQRDAEFFRNLLRDVNDSIAGRIFVDQHLPLQDRIEFLLGRNLVNRSLELFKQRLHQLLPLLLHLLLSLLGRLLKLLLSTLQLALSLRSCRVIEKRLLLLELLDLFLEFLSPLLELPLLFFHLRLHLLLHLLHLRHAHKDCTLVHIAQLLCLGRRYNESTEEKKSREESQYTIRCHEYRKVVLKASMSGETNV